MAPPPAKPQKRRSMMSQMQVTDWVTVQLDKRRPSNKTLAMAPAIVSRLDLEQGTVNLLFPNQLSAHFYRRGESSCILFAIQTYPLAKVHHWEGPTEELNKLLSHALLNFAEQRGTALRNDEMLRVDCEPAKVVMNDKAKVTWSAQTATEQIKKGLVKYVTPGCESGSNSGSTCGSDAETTASEKPIATKKSIATKRSDQACDAKSELVDFTAQLAQLFAKGSSAGWSDSLSMSSIQEALGGQFPGWANLLTQLDAMNKVLVAEDAVFKL